MKNVSAIMLSLLVISISIFTINVQPIKADQNIIDLEPGHNIEFETSGDGVAEWTDEVFHSGSHSAKLLIPEGATTSSEAFVKVPYGDYLNTLAQFSFYVKYVEARPRFAIFLDKNEDNITDALLYSDYLDFGNNEWTIGTGGLIWGWAERGTDTGWHPYSYWQVLYGDVKVLYVSIFAEYWAVEPEGLGKPLYVDDVLITYFPEYTLSVHVQKMFGGAPIQGVNVTVYKDSVKLNSALTDEGGNAYFQVLAGTYTIVAKRHLFWKIYITKEQTVNITQNTNIVIKFPF